MTESRSRTAREEIHAFIEELENHPVYRNPYFEFLQRSPWNRGTYDLHRANFFCRTELTVKGIAHVCARAAQNDDQATLILFAYILNEETGNGDPAHCHEVFMENAHNLYGRVEYDLPPLLVKDAKNSDLVIDETRAYRARIQELIGGSYHRMLGVAMALESHADKMLQICRAAFRANRHKLEDREYAEKVEIYFNSHVGNGVEERHAADARTCVVNNCRSPADVDEVKYGASEMLEVQQRMWHALHAKAAALA